ncbi:MAG: hypothetical protein ABTD50_23320 [Polyangiaceae bacterium]
MCDAYTHVDRKCVAAGMPPTSLPWLNALREFWLSGAFRMVVRKGRQVGASTIIFPRVCVTTALFCQYKGSPGTRITIGCSSTRQKESDERLYNAEHAFAACGTKVRRRDDALEIGDTPIIVQSFPATSDIARGPNVLMWWEDEMPAWYDRDTAVNPASERDGAIVPACVSHENARIYSIGTPMGDDDFHARLVAQSDTQSQRVFVGPSWHWRPELTEERCREIQPDPRLFNREFAAIPQGAVCAAFEGELVDESHQPLPYATTEVTNRICVIDAADLDGGDNCEYAAGEAVWVQKYVHPDDYFQWKPAINSRGEVSGKCPVRDANGAIVVRQPEALPPVLCLRRVWGERARAISSVDILDRIAHACRTRGIQLVAGDQHDAYSNMGALQQRGLTFVKRAWTAENKTAAVAFLRRLFIDGRVLLDPDCDPDDWQTLRRQLTGMQETISNGSIRIRAKSGSLSDRASLLIGAALASMSTEKQPSLFGAGNPYSTLPPQRGGHLSEVWRPGRGCMTGLGR